MVRRIDRCARCRLAVYPPMQGIHIECLKLVRELNIKFLLEEMPHLLNSDRDVWEAQGLAFECDICFRPVIPLRYWAQLDSQYRITTGSYVPSAERIITSCASCEQRAEHSHKSNGQSLREDYRRNVSSPEEIWDIVQDFDEPALCGSKLVAAGLEIGEYINTGSEGAVYHSRPGRVIKFTINPEEARIAVYLQKHWHPGFPRIYKVVDIAEFCEVEPPLYALIKEDIEDTDRDPIKRHLIYLGNVLLEKAASSEYAPLSDIQRAIQDTNDRLLEIEEVMVNSGQRSRIPWLRKQFSRLKKLVLWLNDVKLYAGDVGGANWGFRDDTTIVVRDFGGFSFSRKKKPLVVPKLQLL